VLGHLQYQPRGAGSHCACNDKITCDKQGYKNRQRNKGAIRKIQDFVKRDKKQNGEKMKKGK
jgi:hypothetical protein